ncbi:MAG TPA: glycoside hydrolase family 18 protein [Bacteroidales bacterium]|nr:glycoside hydrolase family 18 protein [Bacteroidales bacterium]
MKRTILVIAGILLTFLSSCGLRNAEALEPDRHFIIAYVFPGNRVMDVSEIDGRYLTHINYAFANVIDGKVVEGFSNDSINLSVLRQVREQNPGLKLLISVGGWSWSGGFSDMALTRESRAKFIESAVEFLKRHDLDGLDIDWEYPGLPGNNNIHRPEDKENFTALLRECRQALDKLGGGSKHYLLTIAAGSFQAYLDNTEMAVVDDYLDFINIMTYDFVGEWGNTTGHHANLFRPAFNPAAMSTASSVELFNNAGISNDKLLIGAAFYGRGWKEVNAENNGLGQPGVGLTGVDLNYHSIVKNFLPDPAFMKLWDNTAKAPYLWNPTERIFITYENPESIREKARFVKESGLRGIMFWQYFGDHEKELLKSMFEEINKGQ